ncbi:hypothetical protein C922_05438 [Plasmodium inui San Antonio 1]|uniref:Uncharacterized protein n=1 Tax=Plasmodium inui San Antonio 1 TaxID=1237626 RepID=W6ZY27_9APIC|nr:hypothetical protein C922_05438 [Plasmodium inui San Antonio 1]EUD64185.1 hypothetical protein C922_05438 [Plasmodium inui San Antonio 1]
MTNALNVGWSLDDWGKPHPSWGYPNTTSGKCTKGNRVPYCYPSLPKKGNSRWEGLDEWLNRVLIESKSNLWGSQFNPSISSGLKDNDKKELTWGQLMDKLIEKIQANQLGTTPDQHKNRIWTGGEWYTVLNGNTISDGGWPDTEGGKNLLIVIVCIFTGLIDSVSEIKSKYPGREDLCSSVDNGLLNTRNKWKSWFGTSGPSPGTVTSECQKGNIAKKCEDAAMSLILTVYTGMSLLCPECGPYYIDRWVTDPHSENPVSNWYYCGVEDNKLQCDKKGRKDEGSRNLWMSPRKELGSKCPPHCTKHLGASISGESQTTKLKEEAKPPKGFPESRQQSQAQKEGTPLKDPPGPGDLGRANRVSAVSTTHAGNSYTSRMSDNQARSPSTPNNAQLTQKGEQHSGKPQVEGKKPEETPKQSFSPLGGGSDQAVTEVSAVPGTETKSGQEGAGLYSIIGGILGVLFLGLAGAYGVFRIWGPRRKRGKKKRALRGGDTMSYGFHGGSGGDGINISVLPFPA